MSASRFDVYAPLHDFQWPGSHFQLSSEVHIRKRETKPDLLGLDNNLGRDEQDKLNLAGHWLEFRWEQDGSPSSSELQNLVLLSLWLSKPTRTTIPYRFEIGRDAAASQRRICRMLERFRWIGNGAKESYDTEELETSSLCFNALKNACQGRGRVNHALRITLSGCFSGWWDVKCVCFATAAETLLTYSKDRGITSRLARVYACLVENENNQRDKHFNDFKILYDLRSDIIHGRVHSIAPTRRLRQAVEFETLIRRIWRALVSSRDLLHVLEMDDRARRYYLEAVTEGYQAPPGPWVAKAERKP